MGLHVDIRFLISEKAVRVTVFAKLQQNDVNDKPMARVGDFFWKIQFDPRKDSKKCGMSLLCTVKQTRVMKSLQQCAVCTFNSQTNSEVVLWAAVVTNKDFERDGHGTFKQKKRIGLPDFSGLYPFQGKNLSNRRIKREELIHSVIEVSPLQVSQANISSTKKIQPTTAAPQTIRLTTDK